MIYRPTVMLIFCFLASLSSMAMDESILRELKGRVSGSRFKEVARVSEPQVKPKRTTSHVAREQETHIRFVSQKEKKELNHSDTVLAPELAEEEVFYNEGMSRYETGNYFEAQTPFLKAAEKKHIGAMYMLGLMFEMGMRGVPQSDGAACDWYSRVYARCGVNEWELFIRDAALRLANLYIHNKSGGQYRGDESIAIYRWLASRGDPNGQFKLGWVYYTGGVYPYEKLIRVDQDYGEAVKWLRKAADQDHIEAMFILGQLFARGIYKSGILKYSDPDESEKWYRKAADKGHVAAFNALLMK